VHYLRHTPVNPTTSTDYKISFSILHSFSNKKAHKKGKKEKKKKHSRMKFEVFKHGEYPDSSLLG
jgi:hypothetical protein